VPVHADAVTQNRSTGKGAGRIDCNDAYFFTTGAERGGQLVNQCRFSGARRACNAHDKGITGVRIVFFQLLNRLRATIVDVAHQSCGGADVAF
jgi:hypothetical protein